MSLSGKIGASMAIGGVYLYSMMKIKFGDAKPRVDKAKAKAK